MTSTTLSDVYDLTDLQPLALRDDPVEYRRFYDQSSGFTAQNAPVQNHFNFRVSDINSLWLLHRAYLLVEFSLVNGGGANERGTFANGLGNLFERAILRLGDTIVEDKPRHAFREYEIDAMSWNKQYADTVGSLMLYHTRDVSNAEYHGLNLARSAYVQAGGAVGTIGDYTITPDAFDVGNSPEAKNRTLTRNNPTFAMIPLYHIFNFPKVYQKILRGYDLEIELFTTSDKVRIIRSGVQSDGTAASTAGADDVNLNWSGSGISLYIPRIVPPAGTMAKINNMLSGAGVAPKVEYERSHVYREAIPTGRADGSWSITTNTSTPTRIYFMLCDQDSETNQLVDLRQRANLLTRLDVYVNGKSVPTENIQAEGATGSSIIQRNFTQYARQWNNLQGNFDGVYHGAMGGGNLDYLSFELNNVISINLKETDDPLLASSSDVKVDYQLDAAAAKDLYLYAVLYSKSTTILEMSEGRNNVIQK